VREIRTSFNDRLGLAWAVVNPLVFIFALSYMRGRMDGGDTHSVPTFEFMMYGMLYIQLFLDVLTNSSSSIKKNKALFAFRQVQPISSVLASSIFYFFIKIAVYIFVLIIMYFLKMDFQIDDPFSLIFNAIALWLIATSLGLIFAIAQCYVPELAKIQGVLTRPLFFISGVFFSMQDIPREYWHYLDWNPILHAIELSRHAAYHTYSVEAVSEFYLFGSALVFTFFALSVYQISWKQAISR
jgi:capsular polysaccharide transport system permease protein